MTRRYTGAIDTGGIGVTGWPDNGVAGHVDRLRTAVDELAFAGIGDRELWHIYASLTYETLAANVLRAHGPRALDPRRPREPSLFEGNTSSDG